MTSFFNSFLKFREKSRYLHLKSQTNQKILTKQMEKVRVSKLWWNSWKFQKHKINHLFLTKLFHFRRNFCLLHLKSLTNREILTKQMKNQRFFKISLFLEKFEKHKSNDVLIMIGKVIRITRTLPLFDKRNTRNENHKINEIIFRNEKYSKTREYSLSLRLGKKTG